MPKVQAAAGSGVAARGPRPARRRRSLAEINVVPLVDVMLVLLIIFMVTAPMIQRGIDVKLPVARARDADRGRARRSSPSRSTYRQDRMRVSRRRADPRRRAAGAHPPEDGDARPTSRCTCAATAACSYQDLMDVIDRLKDAGVEQRRPRGEAAGRALTMDVTDVLRDRMQRAARARSGWSPSRSRRTRVARRRRCCSRRAGWLIAHAPNAARRS